MLAEFSLLNFLVLFKDGTKGESSGGRDAVIVRGDVLKHNNVKVRNFIAILSPNSTPIS